jgi:hypothetical protein
MSKFDFLALAVTILFVLSLLAIRFIGQPPARRAPPHSAGSPCFLRLGDVGCSASTVTPRHNVSQAKSNQRSVAGA